MHKFKGCIMFNYDKLNALCKETGVSKAHLCRLIGRSPYYLRDAEKQKTNITGEPLEKIASALGTTTAYLSDLSDEKKPLAHEDEELAEMLERVKNDPHLRMLFSLTKDATPQDIEKAIKIIQMLKGD